VGAVRFKPSGDRTTALRFTLAVGGGIKWLWNDFIGLRLDGRWTPSLALKGSHYFCDPSGDCASVDPNNEISRLYPFLNSFEFTSGIILRY